MKQADKISSRTYIGRFAWLSEQILNKKKSFFTLKRNPVSPHNLNPITQGGPAALFDDSRHEAAQHLPSTFPLSLILQAEPFPELTLMCLWNTNQPFLLLWSLLARGWMFQGCACMQRLGQFVKRHFLTNILQGDIENTCAKPQKAWTFFYACLKWNFWQEMLVLSPFCICQPFRIKSRLPKLRCGEARAYSDSWQAAQNSDKIHVLDKMPAESRTTTFYSTHLASGWVAVFVKGTSTG